MEHAAVDLELGNPRRGEFLRMRARIARGGGGDEADDEGVVCLATRETFKRGAAIRRAGPVATQLLIVCAVVPAGQPGRVAAARPC